jgi:hypothetical protein
MVKYRYIVLMDLTAEGNALDEKGWKAYFAREDEVAKKYGVKILFRGTPYGVSQGGIEVYETEKYLDQLYKMYIEIGRPKYVAAANTITVTPLPWEIA